MNTNRDRYFEIWWLIGELFRGIRSLREKELSKYNITAWQAYVLYLVRMKREEATPANISRWLFRETHTVAGIINRLESQGYVKRVRNLKPKNRVRIVLTKNGEEAYRHATERISISSIMSTLGDEECNRLVSLLKVLRSKMLCDLGIKHEVPYPFSDDIEGIT
jgi:DNA-binding MarR family transcriptional regulator